MPPSPSITVEKLTRLIGTPKFPMAAVLAVFHFCFGTILRLPGEIAACMAEIGPVR